MLPAVEKECLYGMDIPALEKFTNSWQQPRYIAKLLYHQLYHRASESFSAMSDLSLALRKKLEQHCTLAWLEPSRVQESQDGTRKYLFPTTPLPIETVLIPNSYGANTLCVSSQIGCRWACRFCHTGDMGFRRHLGSDEILNQVRVLQQRHRIDRLVFMGMGEPLDNPATIPTLELLHHGLGFGARRITLSTVGLLPELERFFNLTTPYRLALSVHNPFAEERAQLIPAELVYPLEDVLDQLFRYRRQRRVTFEYTLVEGYNDEARHALELARQALRVAARVNLLQCHLHKSGGYHPVSNNSLYRFQKILQTEGVNCTYRKSRGLDIAAACGMLVSDESVVKLPIIGQ